MVYQKKKFSSKVQFKTTPETIKFCQCHWSPTSRCILKGQIAEDSNPEAHRENKQRNIIAVIFTGCLHNGFAVNSRALGKLEKMISGMTFFFPFSLLHV